MMALSMQYLTHGRDGMSKVAIIRCNTYETEEVYQAVKRGIGLLGGIEQFVTKEEKILLKPNLLSAHAPQDHVTTHPAVFEAMSRLLLEAGYQIFFGDSPAKGSPQRVARYAGMMDVAERYDIPFGNFTQGRLISYPDGHQCKRFQIAEAAIEADAIISLCKMKTHQLTRITGAVKNQLGCVYGLNKAGTHAQFPDAVAFSKMLVDLNMLLKPRLYIMDGIVAMEGNGPNAGDPVPMHVLILSHDPIALDATFCRMIDLDPSYIPSIIYGQEFGLGQWQQDKIEYVGDSLAGFINNNFKVQRLPVKNEAFGFATIFRNPLLRRPVINADKCVKCGVCVEACPVEGKALHFMNKSKNKPPVYRYRKCIRCYCCQEMCPKEAIVVKTPLLGKWLLYRQEQQG